MGRSDVFAVAVWRMYGRWRHAEARLVLTTFFPGVGKVLLSDCENYRVLSG